MIKVWLCRYETEFFINVVHGRGIISWAAVDRSRSDSHCDEIIGFVTARVIAASEGEVGAQTSNKGFAIVHIFSVSM